MSVATKEPKSQLQQALGVLLHRQGLVFGASYTPHETTKMLRGAPFEYETQAGSGSDRTLTPGRIRHPQAYQAGKTGEAILRLWVDCADIAYLEPIESRPGLWAAMRFSPRFDRHMEHSIGVLTFY